MSNRATAPSIGSTTIALRFVADIQAGKRPSIEAALDSAPKSEWPTLLHSLLIAEVNSRMARGEVPLLREYLPRFPTHAAIVRSVLPDFPVAQLAPIVEPLEPEVPSIPVARALVPIAHAATAPIPVAISLPRAFDELEPPQESAPGPQRRRRRKLPWILAGAGVVVLVSVSLVVLKYTSKPRKEPTPPGPEINGPIASSTTTKAGPKVEPKVPAVEGERGLAEWVQKLGGSGTLAMEAGGRRPFNPETPLPKAAFAVAAIALPPDMPPRWNANALSALRGREKLTSIQLNHPTDLTDAALEPLFGLPLQTLELRGANIQITGATLAKFPGLTSLVLLSAPNFSDADLKELATLKKLASLSINSPKFTAEGLKELKPLPLRYLLFGDSVPLGADQVREFQGLPLEEFEASGGLNDDAFLEFAVVQTLKRIRVRKAKLTDAGMKTVAGLGKLEELQISGATLTGAGLEHLNERKGLKILDLSGSQISNEALEKLLALTGLKELRLAGCPIADQGANFLAELEGLETLDLAETAVGDTTLAILKKHATLKSLILTGTKVSSPGVSDFERATPQCKVVIGRRK